jgi:hypothetical protein
METCEVTFDETMPCTSLGFECAGDEEMAEDLFEEEKDEVGDDDGENHAPKAECVPTTSPMTTTEGGPSTSWTTTVRQEDQAREAEVEGEVVSRREAPRRIQEVHPLSKKLGTSTNVHAVKIKQVKDGTLVHQTMYTKDMLRKFQMQDVKPMWTPMGSTATLDTDEDGELVDQREYRSMIGSLLYLTVARPDIQFSVSVRSFSSLAEDITSTGRQEDLQVPTVFP